MDRLRAPNGCPWDREQTHQSLAECLREEASEVLDAIAALHSDGPNDPSLYRHLCEELGDLWLQVAFHACLADEAGRFDMHDVEKMVIKKLVRRHPHIFGDCVAEDSDQVLANWQVIKEKEKIERGESMQKGLLEKMPASLSSLDTAMEIGHQCAKVGFDWPNIDGAMEKVAEELAELQEEYGKDNRDNKHSQTRVEAEFGDLLFSLVQWARHKKIDPDLALRKQMARFKQRFAHVEKMAQSAGGWGNTDLAQMEAAWQEAKKCEMNDTK
jgi:nucleoside triphosphate diphosphatase